MSAFETKERDSVRRIIAEQLADPRHNMMPLEAWASRSPRVRWPIILALIVVLIGLAGGIAS